MKPKFLTEPALLVGKTLIIADLHLGVEYEIFKSGISIPSQLEKIKKRIDYLVKKTKAKELVFLGDIKHNIPVASYQEMREVPGFLKHFSKKLKVFIVKGNHDGNIEKMAKNIKVYSGSGFKIKNFGFAHGQSWISKKLLDCEYLVIGHEHPAIEFKDKIGFRSIEHCWLKCEVNKKFLEEKYKKKCKIKEVIIIPVFNHLSGGIAFNKEDFKPLGPLFKFIKWKQGKVYLLDGTYLGILKELI